MNVITKALSEVGYAIPLEIIQLAFRENTPRLNKTISLDEMIMNKVIRPRVLTDCNLVGGIQAIIKLDRCTIEYGINNEAIVTIPKTLTNNKKLLSVLGLVSNITQNVGGAVNASSGAYMSAASNVVNALNDLNLIQTSRVELIGDNKVLIEEYSMQFVNGAIRCMVENSSNLTNISPRSIPKFTKMVTYAVKAYIYNIMRVRMGKGYIYNGHELGVIKDIIDEYSDSNELYMEYLEKTWKEVAFMNDSMSYDRFIKGMFGSVV